MQSSDCWSRAEFRDYDEKYLRTNHINLILRLWHFDEVIGIGRDVTTEDFENLKKNICVRLWILCTVSSLNSALLIAMRTLDPECSSETICPMFLNLFKGRIARKRNTWVKHNLLSKRCQRKELSR